MSQRKQRAARPVPAVASSKLPVSPTFASFTNLSPRRALALPLTCGLLLAGLGLHSSGQHDPPVMWALWGAAGALLGWTALLLISTLRHPKSFSLDLVFRQQHYVQAVAQLSIYVYWGWYWRQVYDSAYLIAAQLVFAYAFDMLLTWSRRNHYTLGFGPFPIIFSINLFMWFKPNWFYLQFVMVAVGFLVKEFIRWNKDGRRVHIFNPSSFPLGLFALILILTGTTHLTWGPEIAITQIFPPHIYMLIFLVSLPAQFLFGVAAMTMAAVATTYMFILAYFAATGSHFFSPATLGGGAVPIAAFLGMHLLFNDPSTSPRTELGRILFGVLYGLAVITLFGLLERTGIPTHYDKLLAVPVLNLLIQGIDAGVRSTALSHFDPAKLGNKLTPRLRNLGYVMVWTIIFVVMQFQTETEVALARGVSLMSQNQLEDTITHYRSLTRSDPDRAEFHNELGYVLLRAGLASEALKPLKRALELNPDVAQTHNSLGAVHVQANQWIEAAEAFQRSIELKSDYAEPRFNLAQLYDTGRGVEENDAEAARLYQTAAEHGHIGAQVNLGRMYRDGRGVAQDDAEAVRWYHSAADRGHPFAQFNLALMYQSGNGVTQSNVTAHMWYVLAADRLTGDKREVAMEAHMRAIESLGRIEQGMRPAEITESQRLAQEWKPLAQEPYD
jgi:tetratricopeptide (TPR) repeat protein